MTDGRPRLVGVIGWPVNHSLSPRLYGYWLKEHGIDGAYMALPIRVQDFGLCVQALPLMGFAGANVTVPHKEAAFVLADEKDDDAMATGAVNMFVFEDHRIKGLNTDVKGFAASIAQGLGAAAVKDRAVVVLGAGGAARAVVLALARMGASEIRLVNRTRARAESLARLLGRHGTIRLIDWSDVNSAFADAALLVNTTNLGMLNQQTLDISFDGLAREAAVADIVYNPLETALLRNARARGHATVDGLGMLMNQAAPAFARWFGVTPTVTPGLRAELEGALRHG